MTRPQPGKCGPEITTAERERIRMPHGTTNKDFTGQDGPPKLAEWIVLSLATTAAFRLIALWTEIARSIGLFRASAPSHPDLFSAVFMINITESRFSAHTTHRATNMTATEPLRSGHPGT